MVRMVLLKLLKEQVLVIFKKVKKYIKKYKVRIPEIKGKMDQIVVGTKVIKTEQLNILHLAVYQGRMDLLKLICE